MDKILAWHFSNGTLRNDPDTKLVPGLRLTVDPERLELCEYGLHASMRLLDALYYAPGSVLSRVELSGRIIENTDKLVASERLHLSVANIERTLHEFAIWCAEQALALVDTPDPRSTEALRIKRLWLDGTATDNELDAAGAAARAAARAAAWDAVRDAARAAARDAAWAAAWAAARDAAKKKQEKRLVKMIKEAMK